MNNWTLCIWNSNNLNTFAFALIHSHTEPQSACRPDTHAHLPTNTKSSGETLRRRYVDRHYYRSWLFICYLCMPTWAKQTGYNLLKLTNHHKYLQLACFRLIDTLSALDSQQWSKTREIHWTRMENYWFFEKTTKIPKWLGVGINHLEYGEFHSSLNHKQSHSDRPINHPAVFNFSSAKLLITFFFFFFSISSLARLFSIEKFFLSTIF